MPFNTMGWKEYASFLMEGIRIWWSHNFAGRERSFSFERNQGRFNHFFFTPQYSFCRISRK